VIKKFPEEKLVKVLLAEVEKFNNNRNSEWENKTKRQ
jgi:hypothetical protein